MKLDNKKIIIFALILLILAGIIVVVLKGFNVSLSLRAHDTLKFVFDQKFEQSDIDSICKEVFGKQEYQTKTVEVFTDAIYVISPTITDEQKDNLLLKFDALYNDEDTTTENENAENQTDETTEISDEVSAEISTENTESNLLEGVDYDFYSDAKVRIRDIIKPYILPSIISALIVLLYIAIKYRKLNNGKFFLTVSEVLVEMVVILLALLSIIAIIRIPFQATVIPILIFIILCCLVIKLFKFEKKLKELDNE